MQKLITSIEPAEDFDEEFYEIICPEVKKYRNNFSKIISKKKIYYNHYLNYGKNLYKNLNDLNQKLFGEIKIDPNFDENIYEKLHPDVGNYLSHLFYLIPKRKRYYHHYLNFCAPECDLNGSAEIKNYIKNIKKELFDSQDFYEEYKNSIVLVNHMSNPYGATNYLFNLFKILKNYGEKVCILDEIKNEEIYLKYNIDKNCVFSYEKNFIFLCYIYEKLKPKLFYLNSIRGMFIEFLKSIKYKKHEIILHSHEIADAYGVHNIFPNFVVSSRIQQQFLEKYNYKPDIQPPIFLQETFDIIDREFKKDIPVVLNKKGKIDESKITIGMCGSLDSRKNPKLFFDTSIKYPNYNFLWIGGTDASRLPEGHNIYHVPMTPLPFVYYKLIDYFILFSKDDPCPYVVLENLYLNNKVITFKENIYTDHKCEELKNFYFEFDGNISLESVSYMIDNFVKEKANRSFGGKDYIKNNFTKINKNLFSKFSISP